MGEITKGRPELLLWPILPVGQSYLAPSSFLTHTLTSHSLTHKNVFGLARFFIYGIRILPFSEHDAIFSIGFVPSRFVSFLLSLWLVIVGRLDGALFIYK